MIRDLRAFRRDSQTGKRRIRWATRQRRLLAPVALLSVTVLATACASGAGSQSGGQGTPITLGASLSLTGALGSFGIDQRAGYQQAIADANAAGGVKIGGTRHKVKLVVLNNQSDPT